MKKNKYIKLLILAICIIFVIMSVTSMIMSGNVLHTEHCHNDHCHICSLINTATNFIKNVEFIVFNVVMFYVILSIMQIIESKIDSTVRLTLVELKVVQNK